MCITFWLLDKHPAYWVILALNRDEFHARPTLPFHFWEDEGHGSILGGRDLRSGGTWMGLTKTGRLAFLTNVRERSFFDRPRETSRGDLPTRFLKGEQTPVAYAEELAREADGYNGFNLVVADFRSAEMVFVSNGDFGCGQPLLVRHLPPGLHSVSNGTLDSKWQKMERGKRLFAEIVIAPSSTDGDGDSVPSELIVEKVLKDSERASDVSIQIAETHFSEEHERPLSSIFVEMALEGQNYGTRSMTVVGMRRDGQVSLFERYLEEGKWKDHSFQFQIQGQQASAV